MLPYLPCTQDVRCTEIAVGFRSASSAVPA